MGSGRIPNEKIPPSQIVYIKQLSLGPRRYPSGNSSLFTLTKRGFVIKGKLINGLFEYRLSLKGLNFWIQYLKDNPEI